MHQPISLNCQNQRKGYLIQLKHKTQTTNQRQSFADYVNQLGDSQYPNTTRSPRKESLQPLPNTLPKVKNPTTDVMNKRFVINLNKCSHIQQVNQQSSPLFRPAGHSFGNITGRGSILQFQQQRQYSLEMRKSLRSENNKLIPLQHRQSSINISRSVRDDDMTLLYYKVGGNEAVSELNEEFYKHSSQHEMIKGIDDQEVYKSHFKTFLEFAMGKPVFYNLEQLKEKHNNLGLKNKDFNQFKNYLISCFLKVNRGSLDLVFEFSSVIEQFRYCIINSNTPFAIIYNQKTDKTCSKDLPDAIINLAESSYKKIFADNTLAPYFIGIKLSDQAKKLGKIVHQMMGWDQQQDQVLIDMRQSHKGMHLTNVHFTLFKQHLVDSMRNLEIKEKQIELVTTRMDGYRCCIINQDSLLDYFGDQILLQNQIKKYVSLLKKDHRIHMEYEKLEHHAAFIIRYITHQHLPTLTSRDLWTIHHCKHVTAEMIDAFQENFFLLIKNYGLNQLVLLDYEDIWYRLKSNILYKSSIEHVIGKAKTCQIIYKLQMKLQDDENYNDYFKNADYQISLHLNRIMEFIFKNQRIFNSNDLKVIHQSLKIRSSTFDLFVQLIKNGMEEEFISHNLIQEVEDICLYFKKSICS